MLDKLERKLGKYAIPNLMNYLIGGYIIGYACTLLLPGILSYMTLEPKLIISGFQFWRIITWVLIPPQSPGIFTIIMLFFYWQLGRQLENIWGTFRFNVYIIGGILITVIGAFIYYGAVLLVDNISIGMGQYFSTYYINMSIFLAFALSIPDMQILLYFIIPIKMKWLAIVYAGFVTYSFLATPVITEKVSIGCSLLNFIIFFLSSREFKDIRTRIFRGKNKGRRTYNSGNSSRNYTNRFGSGFNPYSSARARSSSSSAGEGAGRARGQISRHKCAICGRTEISNPELEFRFCSKCNGNYEYCNEHLFDHRHIN